MTKSRTPKINLVSPQLFALGLVVEGRNAHPAGVRDDLADALKWADRIFKRIAETVEDLPDETYLEELFYMARKSDTGKKLVARNIDDEIGDIVDEVASPAVFLGMALAFRFLEGGAR